MTGEPFIPPSPPLRSHSFDADDLCPNCGAHRSESYSAGVGCEAAAWTNPGSYHGLAVTPGERLLGETPYRKGMWLAELARRAESGVSETEAFELWDTEIAHRARDLGNGIT
jgi:hypothetical protein